MLLYLDSLSSYDGGSTTFHMASGEHAVRVPQGHALCFLHGLLLAILLANRLTAYY
jgi:predicted 2-oxoglutarate/Fe(II)-dependent dioxygenase YbiX